MISSTKRTILLSTFTLFNLGIVGVDCFDVIVPPGTEEIMVVGTSQPTVVATKDDRIGVKNQMKVNVTADHRVIYGSDLALLLKTISEIIEDLKVLLSSLIFLYSNAAYKGKRMYYLSTSCIRLELFNNTISFKKRS